MSYRGRGRRARRHSGQHYSRKYGETDNQFGDWRMNTSSMSQAAEFNSDDPEREPRTGKAPRHLRGRDIGMWYARRSRARKEEKEKRSVRVYSMSVHCRTLKKFASVNFQNLLKKILFTFLLRCRKCRSFCIACKFVEIMWKQTYR